jgi:hypothetical protein
MRGIPFTNTTAAKLLLIAALACAFAMSAMAQDAKPPSNIGPAPANSKQHKILTGALSPETRQTLQQAMDSAGSAVPAATK